ncbi:MAG TPA: helix-turn-helix domain-containing protein [Mycobacteriales bacterium]|nr:helix-turn-helix domain-containing protein [Mycobacteriales bacterium]
MRPPTRVRKVDSAEAIKALADPIRLKVLSLLMSDHSRAWTVKEIAAALHQPVTKLYHHVNLLAQAKLIRDVETRMVSGIVEHRYASAQRTLEFDDSLYGSPETRDASLANIANLVNQSRDALLDYLGRDDADLDRVLVHQGRIRLSAAEAAELNDAVLDLLKTFEHRRRTKARDAQPRTRVLVLLHPEPTD